MMSAENPLVFGSSLSSSSFLLPWRRSSTSFSRLSLILCNSHQLNQKSMYLSAAAAVDFFFHLKKQQKNTVPLSAAMSSIFVSIMHFSVAVSLTQVSSLPAVFSFLQVSSNICQQHSVLCRCHPTSVSNIQFSAGVSLKVVHTIHFLKFYTHEHTYTCIYEYTCTHTHTLTHMHACTHTHTRTTVSINSVAIPVQGSGSAESAHHWQTVGTHHLGRNKTYTN